MSVLKKGAARMAAAAGLLLALLAGIFFSGISADAESIYTLRTDFTAGGGGWSVNTSAVVTSGGLEMLPGGRAQTDGTVDGVLLFVEFGSVSSSAAHSADVTLEFGVAADGSSACSLTFDGDILRAVGLTDEGGASAVILERTVETGSMVKVEIIGGYVEVSVKSADGAYDYLGMPVAAMYFADGAASREGSVAISVENGTATVLSADVYSLSGSVPIETEDAPAETPEEPSEGESGALEWWAVLLIVFACVIVAGGAVFLTVWFLKKKKTGGANGGSAGNETNGGNENDENNENDETDH